MISIIVPVYKTEQYLHQCIDSLLNQTYQDIEIILIDDGSPDKCGKICDEYVRIDSRVRVFHTGNKGLPAARNFGLRVAKGEYIAFVDSDDWVETKMYGVLLQMIENNNADISVCGTWFEFMNQKRNMNIADAFYSGQASIAQATISGQINNHVWNKLYKRECLTDLCFPEGKTYEDLATTYKVLLKAHSVSCTSTPFYHYRMREGSITHSYTMNNLKDFWNAGYGRYLSLKEIPEVKNNQKILRSLEKELAEIVAWIWRSTYRISSTQRDYIFLHKVSYFVQNHFPLFGRNDWNNNLRICIFFSRFSSQIDLSIFFLHVICVAHKKIARLIC